MQTQNIIGNSGLDKHVLGIALMVGFCCIAPLLDVFAKLASKEIPIGQIIAVRFI